MLVTKDNTYKIMSIEEKDLLEYEEMGFFKCDKNGNKLQVKAPSKKKSK